MSNATQDSRSPGGPKRRRRNRGGRNRNNSNPNGGQQSRHGDRQDRHREPRESREPRGEARPRRTLPPVKLTWWQKLLKAIGLYKEPVRPPRPERPERTDRPGRPENKEREPREPREAREPRSPKEPVKSNIRIARGNEGGKRPLERGPVESSRLYIGNLSYDVSEMDLTELFKGIGTVRNVEIVYNRNTHRSKGYGFVEMLNVDDAKRSVEVLHDQFFMGRKLNVSGAKSKGFDEREDRDDDERQERQERRPKPAVAETAAPAVEAPAAATEAPAPVAESTPVAAAPAPAPVAEAEATPAPEPTEPTDEKNEAA